MAEWKEPVTPEPAPQSGPPSTIGRLSSGERAIREYLNQNSARLLGIIRGCVARAGFWWRNRDEEVAQELLSEVALEALRSGDRFDPERQVEPWIRGIALNCIRRKMEEFVRRNRELLETELPHLGEDALDDALGGLSPAESPEKRYSLQELESRVGELSGILKPVQLRIVKLRLQDYSHREIAAQLYPDKDIRKAEGALRTQFCRIKKLLGDRLTSGSDQ